MGAAHRPGVLLSVMLGMRESYEDWLALARDLRLQRHRTLAHPNMLCAGREDMGVHSVRPRCCCPQAPARR
ncbi:MAG TPA: hypothetical protein VFV03_04025 [Solirubrobacteraceae bacterium]|nr:hypothetical protein [Solirubrobacteraceae bacterium]